jgi:hypothetical protein
MDPNSHEYLITTACRPVSARRSDRRSSVREMNKAACFILVCSLIDPERRRRGWGRQRPAGELHVCDSCNKWIALGLCSRVRSTRSRARWVVASHVCLTMLENVLESDHRVRRSRSRRTILAKIIRRLLDDECLMIAKSFSRAPRVTVKALDRMCAVC